MGHWSPGTESSPVRSFCLILRWDRLRKGLAIILKHLRESTYSRSDQSTPAGQRSEPVTSWLKPLSVFTFRAIGGMRGSPGFVSQSIMAPLRLLVSSDLALDAPFCNWRISELEFFENILGAYHDYQGGEFILGITCHQAILKSRYGPE